MKPFIMLLAFLPFAFGAAGASPGPGPKKSLSAKLKIDYEGDHFTVLTTGKLIKVGRNKKSGVWNTPARKGMEIWIRNSNEKDLIRLDPLNFRRQLIGLLAEYPELHNHVRHPSFRYQELSANIAALEVHIEKVHQIRAEKERFEIPGTPGH